MDEKAGLWAGCGVRSQVVGQFLLRIFLLSAAALVLAFFIVGLLFICALSTSANGGWRD
jgi:hypothetical protein